MLGEGNAGISSITIGTEGEVFGGVSGVVVRSAARINNLGTIVGDSSGIAMAGGQNETITNSGTISGGNFSISQDQAFNGATTITNYGTLQGMVFLSAGNDVFTNFKTVGTVIKHGTVNGVIDLGGGADKFKGGNNAETVQDGDGADNYNLGGGNDTYIAAGHTGSDGNDIVNGGAGIDTYDASASYEDTVINLDVIDHPDFGNIGNWFPDRNTGGGEHVSGLGFKDTVTAFENAIGGSDRDLMFGTAAANRLEGRDGGDRLSGYGGSDTLLGGAGIDVLNGGTGRDFLTGGADDDNFSFTAINHSGPTAANRDLILDFEDGSDTIDLFNIDAIRGTAFNDEFTFKGTNVKFGGTAGELRAYWTADGQIIEGDVNGDRRADFSIKLFDPTHAINLDALDFIL
jgi:Ca2+-binding RTX toxin-like protein